MPNDKNSNSNSNSQNSDSNFTINKDACEKYGITLSEIPTEPVEPYSRYHEDDTVYGFVTEVSHDQNGTEVEIKDWGYCLEDNTIELGFQNMPRSQIMEEVIKSYGLVPIVDLSGLNDDIINWNNSTSNSSDSNTGGGGNITSNSGSQAIDDAVKQAIQGCTTDLDKAKAIDKAFKDHVAYNYYWNCNFTSIDEAWKDGNLNCADGANVLCAMFISGGLSAVIVHVPGHYIVKVKIGGKDYYTDNCCVTGQHNPRPFGEVWKNVTNGEEVGTKISS